MDNCEKTTQENCRKIGGRKLGFSGLGKLGDNNKLSESFLVPENQ
jgi:hypothetical protein